jgi:hypothetical protein
MKNLLIASAMAVASVLSFAPQSQAASVTVTTSERPAPRHYADNNRHRPRHHDCMVKKVKTYRHGHVVIKETRVCR